MSIYLQSPLQQHKGAQTSLIFKSLKLSVENINIPEAWLDKNDLRLFKMSQVSDGVQILR